MFLGLSEETWAALATSLITALAAVFAAWLGYQAMRSGGEGFGRRHHEGPDARVRLVAVDVTAEVYERPRRGPWWKGLALLFLTAASGLLPFAYAIYRHVDSGLEERWWLVVAFLFGAPGAASLGWLVGLLQIGFDHAGTHSQKFRVEGDLELLTDRSTKALSRMKAGVRKLGTSGRTATIEASRLRAPQNFCIQIEQREGGTCFVQVATASQPGVFSFRRNSRQVALFICELTGVRVYPASFIPRRRKSKKT